MTLDAAYAACRTIAQREAKNFYYSFRVLPKPKMDAISRTTNRGRSSSAARS
jgi:phytoene synthase